MSDTSWGEIEALVLAAAARPPKERAELIDRRCTDPGLRAGLSSLTTQTSPDGPAVAGATLGLEAGDAVGPYVVARRLGRGGMGEVFLARDSRLHRAVALKCLFSSDAAPHELRERIVREARLAARVTHPNVAAVHDVVDHGGRTFIVMEYVEGESLASALRREPMPEARVVHVGRQLAAALSAAHREGIVHRDLKPANIQVTPHGSVKILDFGIATAYAAMSAATTGTAPRLEAITVPAGTLGYMSPEQLLGRPLDERSDIFSLAVVLYEMATGRTAFDVRDPMDNLAAIIRGVPRADGTGRVITERVADVIARGLESDPGKRFPSAAEMLAALDAIPAEAPPRDRAAARTIVRASAGVGIALASIWTFGWMTCAVYNNTFQRPGAFAAESPAAYFVWGVKSLVAPTVEAALLVLAYRTCLFASTLLALVPRVARWRVGMRARMRVADDRLGLADPVTLAQTLASLGLLALLLVVWRFNQLIVAWGAFASTGGADGLRPLGSDDTKLAYRFVLTVLLLAFSAGLFRVLLMRRRLAMRRGRGSVAALTTIVVCLLLLNEVPYRIMWGRSYRAELRGTRCYVIGESADRYLLFCPAAAVPRNQVVRRDDAGLRVSAVFENVFTQP